MDCPRLLPILIATLAERRLKADGKVRHVAGHADVAEKTIYNFERGVTGRTTWPDDTDEIVYAYAKTLNVAPADLWRDALARWEAAIRASSEALDETLGPGPDTGGLERGVQDGPPSESANGRTRPEDQDPRHGTA